MVLKKGRITVKMAARIEAEQEEILAYTLYSILEDREDLEEHFIKAFYLGGIVDNQWADGDEI